MNLRLRQCALISVLATGVSIAGPVLAQEAPLRGCAAKQHAIERELSYAREHHQNHRVKGLERALDAARDCNDGALQRERESRIREAEEKVEARKKELAQEQAEGKRDDIRKAERKLAEAEADLSAARAERER